MHGNKPHSCFCWAFVILATLTCGCRTMSGSGGSAESITPKLAPAFFGALLPGYESPLSQQWNAWGSEHLQDGDLIFTMGESRVVMGLINFSKFSSEIAASRFSHVGLIAIEDGKPYVYDTVSGGPRRKELGWYVTHGKIERVAFKRPQQQLARHGADAVQFCRWVHKEHVPFDEQFRLDDDRYYCAELVDLAYRRSGLPLCQPVAINDLPKFDEFSRSTVWLVETFTSISADQRVIFPGNEKLGIWSSPALQVLVNERSPYDGPPKNS